MKDSFVCLCVDLLLTVFGDAGVGDCGLLAREMGAGRAVSEGNDGVGLRRGMEEEGAWAVGYGKVCLMGKGTSQSIR